MRRWLPLALLLLLLPVVAGSQTWLRDDTGAVAPPVVFQGSGAAQTRTSSLDPLPVTSGATTSTTDPFGWGRSWVGLATPVVSTGFWVDDKAAIGFLGGATLTYFRSENGITWANVGAVAYFNTAGVTGSILLPNGRAMILTGIGSGFTAGTCPTTIATGGCVGTTGTGPAGIGSPGLPIIQGSTILWTAPGTATGFVCRSTNNATSATCAQPAGITGQFDSVGQYTASPALSTWLTIDTTGQVFRSVDDGTTWTAITTLSGAGTTLAIACGANNVCVAANTLNIHRSTDGGATWSLVQTTNVNLRGFVVFGRDVIVALRGTAASASVGARSTDNGATWSQLGAAVTVGADALPQGISTTANGNALYFNGNISYSKAIGAGEQGIVGETGVRWNINPVGDGGVFQGTSAANGADAAWQMVPIQRDTLTNSQTTGAANTAVTVTIGAATDQRAHLYKVAARCSAGTSSLTVQYPSGTTRWSTEAAEVTTTNFTERWNPGLTTTANTAMVITLATCGVGNTGTLIVQADRF